MIDQTGSHSGLIDYKHLQYCTLQHTLYIISGLYRIHDHNTSVSRGLTRALSTLRGVPSLNLRRRSPSGRRFYKASRCCKSPFVRGARPNGQSNGSYRVRVHVARAAASQNVACMPPGAGTSPCGAHLLQADHPRVVIGVDLSCTSHSLGPACRPCRNVRNRFSKTTTRIDTFFSAKLHFSTN